MLRIRQISREALEIPQGSLYPALYRLEHQGLIAAEWGQSETNRRAKYYTLTAAGGQSQLDAQNTALEKNDPHNELFAGGAKQSGLRLNKWEHTEI